MQNSKQAKQTKLAIEEYYKKETISKEADRGSNEF